MFAELLQLLPQELKYYILLFDTRFIWRKGKLITIGKINLIHFQSLSMKQPICLSKYGDNYEHKEFSIYFSNPNYRLFYDEMCQKIVFEKTMPERTIWHIRYLI
jgi:hypothetical protein